MRSHTFGILHASSISIKVCPTRGVRSWLFCCSFALPLLWAIQSWEGVLDIFWCKTFIPKRLYAKNGSMKSISIHVSTTFGATSRTWGKWLLQMQEMKSLDKGQFSKKRYAIFFEASAKVHEALTLACKFCVFVWVGESLVSVWVVFVQDLWMDFATCHGSINLPDLTCQVDVRVGYYTSVYGLGRHPKDTQVLVFATRQLGWRRWTFQTSIKKRQIIRSRAYNTKSKGALCNAFAQLYI